jgi:NTP pyrophosphatase (non-canonical NTP hydrolase)
MEDKIMTLTEYQDWSQSVCVYPKDKAIEYVCLGLASECGELCGKIKKIIRDDNNIITDDKREQIAGEIGDCLFYLTRVASETGLWLEAIMSENVKKLNSRKERGVLGGSGDNR